ncbi:protein phosphatase 1 regulatory subunit 37 [Brachyhypopomus gauderio]|uniref:protein phosphatase 1 regulatory subunit 37 n=1 Tax=Brachyhypopomus gauderio TaxID=698409 RepID=UPI0040425F24
MNSETQALDVRNAKTKTGVDDHPTAPVSEEIIPRLMDRDVGRPVVDATAPGAAVLTRTTGCHAGGQDDKDKRNKEEVFSKNNGVKTARVAVCAHPDSASNDHQSHESSGVILESQVSQFSVGDVVDDGDMDIGVDLSLDESGVLESEPVTSSEESASVFTSASSLTTETKVGRESHEPSELGGSSVPSSFTSAEVLSPSSVFEETGPKHKAKRVTFPSDENIVSGSVEPKDPWRHAQNVTVEEILNAYKQTCQKLNCKPIPKVLLQIQDLTELTQRNECLDLKGEKLDYKACESLEEIFKRVQFKVVNLEQTNLDEDGASALFDMIEYYESATHLNISFNKHIGSRGWQAAAHMMRKTSSLQYLDARNTPLLDHSAPFVARALRISGSLAVLHLENAGLSGRPLMLLATALKMNMNLRELYLADNKLNGLQDSAQLGNLLKFNYNIQILDLRNNHMLDSGLAYVCEGLKEQRKGLVTLVLWNNQLTHNGMGYLAAALPCTQSLETLNLGHNAIGNEGVHKLKDSLIANRSLLRLGLASTKLSCEGAVAVAEFVAESPRLVRLDLRENEIKTGGLMALSLALKVNSSLLRLDLDREPKKETVKSFIETQRALLAEIQNGCKRNFILAKEKEESQLQVSQSASMAEIATEETQVEEEEEGPATAAGPQDGEKSTGEVDPAEGEKPIQHQDGESQMATVQDDSDSDTDEEEEEEEEEENGIEVTKNAAQTPPPVLVINPVVSASQASLAPPPTAPGHTPASPEVPASDSGQGVKEASVPAVPAAAPPSPGRCISVSSPGRGHKIFMVTRVESPPEKQQSLIELARSLQGREPESKTPTAPAPSLQQPKQTPSTAERSGEASDLSPETSERPPQAPSAASSQPDQTGQTSVLLAGASPQPGTEQLLPAACSERDQHQEAAESRNTTQTLPRDEGVCTGQAQSQQTSAPADVGKPLREAVTPHLEENVSLFERPPEGAVADNPLVHLAVSSESDQQTKTVSDQQMGPDRGKQEPVRMSQDSVEERGSVELEVGVGGDLMQRDAHQAAELAQAQMAKHESNSQQQTGSEPTAETTAVPERPLVEQDGIVSTGAESSSRSPCQSGAEENEGVGTERAVLPNGLKPEFAFHLLEPEGTKAARCIMEHVSVTAELSCGQDLEELLLEASLDTSRDAP